jgi:radical SAM superfamily enzyme YgiQ (UPF0313 family)
LSKKGKEEVYIEKYAENHLGLDLNKFRKSMLKVTNPNYYIFSSGFIIHPLTSVFYKVNNCANEILNYINVNFVDVDAVIKKYSNIADEDIINFIALLVQLDLCYICSDTLNVWNSSKKAGNIRFDLKSMDCLFINTSEWHAPTHYNVLPKVESPLGLLYMATVLKKRNIKSGVLDLGLFPEVDFNDIESILRSAKPKIIGITSRSSNLKTVLDLTAFIKKNNENIIIIIGGIAATNSADKILSENPQIDIICNGEGEETIFELVETLVSHREIKLVKGISFLENDIIVTTAPRETIKDLNLVPYPDYSLMILPISMNIKEIMKSPTIITSRGCPYTCKFCCTMSFWGNNVRYRSVENIIGEIIDLKDKYDIESFNFSDDLFTFSKKRVKEICEKLIELDLKLTWGCSSRVNCVDRDMIKLMKKAGCTEIFFGIESLDDEVLSFSQKNTNKKMIEKAIKIMGENKVLVTAGIILGLPKQKKSDVEELYKLFDEQSQIFKRDNPSILQLFKNTDFYDSEKYFLKEFHPPRGSYFSDSETKSVIPEERNIIQEYIEIIIPSQIKRNKMLFWYQIPAPMVCDSNAL